MEGNWSKKVHCGQEGSDGIQLVIAGQSNIAENRYVTNGILS